MTRPAPSAALLARLARRFGNAPGHAAWLALQAGPDRGLDGGRGDVGLPAVREDLARQGAPGDGVGHDDRGPLQTHEDAHAEFDALPGSRAVLDGASGEPTCPSLPTPGRSSRL